MDSVYKVPYTTIVAVGPHSNAERLELATVYGFQVIVPKGVYKPGDKIVYIPIDSILSEKVEALLFAPDAKVKLNNRRVRQIKLRGLASQGMIANPESLKSLLNFAYVLEEQDVAEMLGITKYEPPVKGPAQTPGKPGSRKAQKNPNLHEYNGLTNIKWVANIFENEEVVIQCKLHGTNARFGNLPRPTRSILDKVLNFFNLLPKYEFCYGSNRVQISSSSSYKGFYEEDIYGKVFKKIKANEKVKINETIFGEIIGPGIQAGYAYGLTEHTFVLFDVKILNSDGTQTWLNPEEVEKYAQERGFEFVPVLYKGIYNKELAYSMSKGPSVYCPAEPVREGIVIKSRYKYNVEGNKMAVKWINEDYLDNKNNTDNH